MTRSEAARVNGAQSSGPVTLEGKHRSSLNATRHGLYSAKVVIPGESQEDFDAMLDEYILLCRPAGAPEMHLVETMVAAQWRLRRVLAMEHALFSEERVRLLNDIECPIPEERVVSVAMINLLERKSLSQIDRFERRLVKIYEGARAELARLQNERAEWATRAERNEPDDLAAEEACAQAAQSLLEQTFPTEAEKQRAGQFLQVCVAEARKHQAAEIRREGIAAAG